MMLARETGFQPGSFAHTIINAHIYVNHIEGLKSQLAREPKKLPSVRIADKPFFELGPSDISLEGYDPHPGIKFAVAV
jgi:thymidylate synthase